MPVLLIEAAMVNPVGKAKRLNRPVTPDILNEEWVQIRNTGTKPVNLRDIELLHWTYPSGAGNAVDKLVMRLAGTLAPLAALRIHSGKGVPWFDAKHNIYHGYINPRQSYFLFQISRPDCMILVTRRSRVDYARYDPPVPEGKRLKRTKPHNEHILAVGS